MKGFYKNHKRSKYSFADINFLGKCNLDFFFLHRKGFESFIEKEGHEKISEIKNAPIFKMNNLEVVL